MTLTLTASIDADIRYLEVTGTVTVEPGYRFRIGDELLELQGFVQPYATVHVDPNQWYVRRGLDLSTAASHTAGDEILGAADAFVAATSGTTPPDPFAGGGSGDTPDLDAVLDESAGQDIADALTHASAPDAGNVFATLADIGGGGGGISKRPTSGFYELNWDDEPLTPGEDASFDVTIEGGTPVEGEFWIKDDTDIDTGAAGINVVVVPFDCDAATLQGLIDTAWGSGNAVVTGTALPGGTLHVALTGAMGSRTWDMTTDTSTLDAGDPVVTVVDEGVDGIIALDLFTPEVGDFIAAIPIVYTVPFDSGDGDNGFADVKLSIWTPTDLVRPAGSDIAGVSIEADIPPWQPSDSGDILVAGALDSANIPRDYGGVLTNGDTNGAFGAGAFVVNAGLWQARITDAGYRRPVGTGIDGTVLALAQGQVRFAVEVWSADPFVLPDGDDASDVPTASPVLGQNDVQAALEALSGAAIWTGPWTYRYFDTIYIAVTADSGTFTLTANGETTDPIAFDADLPTMVAALNALEGIGPAGAYINGAGIGNIQFVLGLLDAPVTADDAGLVGDAVSVGILPADATVELFTPMVGQIIDNAMLVLTETFNDTSPNKGARLTDAPDGTLETGQWSLPSAGGDEGWALSAGLDFTNFTGENSAFSRARSGARQASYNDSDITEWYVTAPVRVVNAVPVYLAITNTFGDGTTGAFDVYVSVAAPVAP